MEKLERSKSSGVNRRARRLLRLASFFAGSLENGRVCSYLSLQLDLVSLSIRLQFRILLVR